MYILEQHQVACKMKLSYQIICMAHFKVVSVMNGTTSEIRSCIGNWQYLCQYAMIFQEQMFFILAYIHRKTKH